MDCLVEVGQILLHADGLSLEDAAVAGGVDQFDHGEEHQLGLLAYDFAFLHHVHVFFKKGLGFFRDRLGECTFEYAPGQVFGDEDQEGVVCSQAVDDIVEDEDHLVFESADVGFYKCIMGISEQLGGLMGRQFVS